jgi:hypothetical protein
MLRWSRAYQLENCSQVSSSFTPARQQRQSPSTETEILDPAAARTVFFLLGEQIANILQTQHMSGARLLLSNGLLAQRRREVGGEVLDAKHG